MDVLLLALAMLVGLVLIPLGLPGLWLMVGSVLLHSYAVPTSGLGTATLLGVAAIALVAEVLEFLLAGRFARRYGGSRRAGWGAIIGGIVGAVVGVPVPIVGSMVGAFVGSFAGALLAELTRGTEVGTATRVAQGALWGRVAAVAVKVASGVVIAIWALFAVWL